MFSVVDSSVIVISYSTSNNCKSYLRDICCISKKKQNKLWHDMVMFCKSTVHRMKSTLTTALTFLYCSLVVCFDTLSQHSSYSSMCYTMGRLQPVANLGKNVDRCINSRRECTCSHEMQTPNKKRGSAEFIQSLQAWSIQVEPSCWHKVSNAWLQNRYEVTFHMSCK